MTEILNDRFLLRGGLKAALVSLNEVPLRREMIIELDDLFSTGKLNAKIGDGATHYVDLPYLRTDSSNAVKAIIAGMNIEVDATDPENPIVSSTLGAVNLKGRKATYADLPSTGNTAGDAWQLDSDGLIYVWDGTAWPVEGNGIGGAALDAAAMDATPIQGGLTIPTKPGMLFSTVYNGQTWLIPAYLQAAAESDPYWSSVVSLLHFDGVNNAQTFTDQKGVVWTPSDSGSDSGVYLSTASPKFGSAALKLRAGSTLSAPGLTVQNYEDYTVEGWVNPTSADMTSGIVWLLDYSGSSGNMYAQVRLGLYNNKWDVLLSQGNQSWYNTSARSAGDAIANQWSHIAIVVHAGAVKTFVNGALRKTDTPSTLYSYNQNTLLGVPAGGNFNPSFAGMIDDFRVTKGVARYLADFTAPVAPFPNQ